MQAHGKADTSIFVSVKRKEMNDTAICNHIKTKSFDLYPLDDTVDDSYFQLLCPILHICMFDWCDEEFDSWQKNITLSPAEETWLEEEIVKALKGSLKVVWSSIKNEKEVQNRSMAL